MKGPLFIVNRNNQPFYQIIILNREQIKTLVETITPCMLVDNAEDYFMYSNKQDEITGFWFYDKHSKNQFSAELEK